MPSLEALFSRADVGTLEDILGLKTVRLLQLLDEDAAKGKQLVDVLLSVHPPAELLTNRQTREILLGLLRPKEATELCGVLGLSSDGNPYDVLRTARFPRSRKEALFTHFRVEMVVNPDDAPIDAVRDVAPGYGLFPHQEDAASRVTRNLSRSERRCVLHMPTGAGKTRTAMYLVASTLRDLGSGVVVWLAHSEELCEQAASEFESAWQYLGVRSVQLVRFWGAYNPDLVSARDGLVVAGLAKAYSLAMSDMRTIGRLAERLLLIVMDEAHQAIAPTYQSLLDALFARNPNARLLGLTATPGRTWNDIEEDARLSAFFANRKVTLQVPGYSSPVDYLIDKGYLSRPLFRTVEWHQGIELSASELSLIEQDLDIPRSVLEKLSHDIQRNLRILFEIKSLAGKHSRILVFATTVEHALVLAAVLTAKGGTAAKAVTGSMSSVERSRAIQWYLSVGSESRVLINYGVLTTGFDAPRTSAALIARPTKSLVLYSQMVGRATRGVMAGGNVESEIVTVVDTSLPGFGNLVEAFNNWEDSGWDEEQNNDP